MNHWLIATSVGAVLIVMGGILLRSHWLTWQRQKNDSNLDEYNRKHYYAQYRRRMQTSALLVLLGILIPIGDGFNGLIPWQKVPGIFAFYWLGVLMLTVWVILLGLGDFASIRAHSRVELSRVQQKRRALEKQLEQLKKKDSNGHHP